MTTTREEASPRARGLLARLRDLRHRPEGLLHSRRRDAAISSLTGFIPQSVLFVCHGNICRSPFAAVAFKQALPDFLAAKIKIDSVGFIGAGRRPPTAGLSAAGRRGLDMSEHRSKIVTAEILRQSDLVVVMAPEQLRGVKVRLGTHDARLLVLGDLDPEPITRRTIVDPWNGDDALFDESYDRIHRCVKEMARIISGRN